MGEETSEVTARPLPVAFVLTPTRLAWQVAGLVALVPMVAMQLAVHLHRPRAIGARIFLAIIIIGAWLANRYMLRRLRRKQEAAGQTEAHIIASLQATPAQQRRSGLFMLALFGFFEIFVRYGSAWGGADLDSLGVGVKTLELFLGVGAVLILYCIVFPIEPSEPTAEAIAAQRDANARYELVRWVFEGLGVAYVLAIIFGVFG